MARIVRASRPAAAPAAGRAIAGEAGAGLAGELAARVVLGHQLDVSILGPAGLRLVLDAKIGQLEVVVDDGQIVRLGKCEAVGAEVDVVVAVVAIQEVLVVALEFVVEDDAGDAAALALDLSRFLLVETIESGRRAGARAASRRRRSTPAGGHPGGSTRGRPAGPSLRESARRRVGRRRDR